MKWAYKAVFISSPNMSGPAATPDSSASYAVWQDEMNRHGVHGWEAFWIIEKANGAWVFFKTAEPPDGVIEDEDSN